MGLKQRHKTTWNDDKRYKDGLNTDRDMAFSSKRETTAFEIKTRNIGNPPPLPHPLSPLRGPLDSHLALKLLTIASIFLLSDDRKSLVPRPWVTFLAECTCSC